MLPRASASSFFAMSDCVVPRNFKLLDELEKGEKGEGGGLVSYGIKNPENPDIFFHHWHATLIPDQHSAMRDHIFSLSIFVPDEYPAVPPRYTFQGQAPKHGAVRSDGTVEASRLNWPGAAGSIASGLAEIRQKIVGQAREVKAV